MKKDTKRFPAYSNVVPDPHHQVTDTRYSLKAMMDEVAAERRNSHFARELVDTTEIEKMFNKQIHNKKKK